MGRFLKWTGGVLALLILALVIFLSFFDWSLLRRPVASLASSVLGRSVSIGELAVNKSRAPRITVKDIEVANPVWSKTPSMLGVDRLDLKIALDDLLKGQLTIPEMTITRPKLVLERTAEGKINWDFASVSAAGGPVRRVIDRGAIPVIERLHIDQAIVRYHDAKAEADFMLDLASLSGMVAEKAVRMEGRGEFQGQPFVMEMRGGPLSVLRRKGVPYPVDTKLSYGEIRTSVRGTLLDPARLRGVDLQFNATGPGLAALKSVIGMPLTETPPFDFQGNIRRDNGRWQVERISGTLGNSRFSGDIELFLRNRRPFAEGKLFSDKLDLRDFAGFIGFDLKPLADKKRLLPDQELQPKTFRLADADIEFASDNIVTPFVPADGLSTRLVLEQGVLTVQPALITIGTGSIHSSIELDASKERFLSSIKAELRQIPIRRLVAKTRFADETAGKLIGRVDLATEGRSVAQMAGSADGTVLALMEQGSISKLLMALSNIDLARTLGLVVAGDRGIPIRCLIADYVVDGGVMKTELVLMDTTDNSIITQGRIDLGKETVDLRITPTPKGTRPLPVGTTVTIKGSVGSLEVEPEVGSLLAKGAASLALAPLLAPAAGLIPWAKLGLAEDSSCRALVTAAKEKEDLDRAAQPPP